MSRTRKGRHRGRDEIAAILDRFDRSGLTHAAFAGRERLSLSTLRSWLARRRQASARSVTTFVPVALRDQPMTETAPIVIELGQDRRILVPLEADAASIARLLPILVAAC